MTDKMLSEQELGRATVLPPDDALNMTYDASLITLRACYHQFTLWHSGQQDADQAIEKVGELTERFRDPATWFRT